MRNRELHAALRDFALDAASLLTHEVAEGAELGYDVLSEPGRGPSLYRYQPLTAVFIEARWESLRTLATFPRAARALGSGASSYLRVRGVTGADPGPALRAMLERLYEDASDFEFPEERFERVYAEVEGTLYAEATGISVIAPLPGLVLLEDARVELGNGLALIAGDTYDAPPEAVWPHARRQGRSAEPSALCLLERPDDDEAPLEDARDEFMLLVRRLRMYKRGAIGLGALGWARAGGGVWQPFDVDSSPAGHGERWALADDELHELCEFLELCARTRPGGAIEWALDRLELGCERDDPIEAISDYLLALRALLDGGGPASLGLRLSALCAEEGERRHVERRLEAAIDLEQLAIAGRAFPPYLAEVGAERPRELVEGVEGYLRALLRDTYCGYLDQDVRRVADDLLVESGEPLEISASDLRAERRHAEEPQPDGVAPSTGELAHVGAEGETGELFETGEFTEIQQLEEALAEPEPAPQPEHEPEPDPEPEQSRRGLTARIAKAVRPDWTPPEPEPYVPDPGEGVTPSLDWDFDDDDTGAYSAPV